MSANKVAIVTGAAGFIGSHMVDLLLEQGYQVRGLDNLSAGRLENLQRSKSDPNFEFERCDLRALPAVLPLFEGAHYVFHFAGIADVVPSIERPADYASVNIMGTINALEAARAAGVHKFVYAASSSCYGLTDQVPTSEEVAIDVQHPYALSKFLGEEAVMHWGKVFGLPVVALRIFNAFGPRSRTSGAYGAVFGVFLAQKLANQPFTVVGDGTQTRDFLFVTDVARAFLLAAESDRNNEFYNLGAGHPQSVNRLVEMLEGPVVHLPKRSGEPDCTWADISKIRSHLGWEPLVSFEEGVSIMLEQIENWRDAPLWDPESIGTVTEAWFSALPSEELAGPSG